MTSELVPAETVPRYSRLKLEAMFTREARMQLGLKFTCPILPNVPCLCHSVASEASVQMPLTSSLDANSPCGDSTL